MLTDRIDALRTIYERVDAYANERDGLEHNGVEGGDAMTTSRANVMADAGTRLRALAADEMDEHAFADAIHSDQFVRACNWLGSRYEARAAAHSSARDDGAVRLLAYGTASDRVAEWSDSSVQGAQHNNDAGSSQVAVARDDANLVVVSAAALGAVDRYAALVGMDEAKRAMSEAVVLPRAFPHCFEPGTGRRAPQRVLMYGPPGTGKTTLARAIAEHLCRTFTHVRVHYRAIAANEVFSAWLGESEKRLHALFAAASADAKTYAQRGDNSHGGADDAQRLSVVFIDEIDTFARARSNAEDESTRRLKNTLLLELDAVACTHDLVVLASTNRPQDIDTAVLRRFDRCVHVPLPDAAARAQMFANELPAPAHAIDVEQCATLASHTEGWSGADIRRCCQEALMEPVRELLTAEWVLPVAADAKLTATAVAFVPCDESEPDKVPLRSVTPALVRPRALAVDDVLHCVRSAAPTVSAEDLRAIAVFRGRYDK